MCLDALTPSMISLVYFQPGALTGFALQSFTEQRSHGLSTGHPLLRLTIHATQKKKL
jgi:hypothetical protein